jgi:hypothetical protein
MATRQKKVPPVSPVSPDPAGSSTRSDDPAAAPSTTGDVEHPEVAGATAIGAAAAGMTGAAIGTAIGGPVGGVVGAAVGSVAGGVGAHALEHKVNPTIEDAYWRNTHHERPYVEGDLAYDEHWRPAYRHGWEARMMHGERAWDDVEPDLEKSWAQRRGHSALDWARAKLATRDAWERLEGREGHDPDQRRDH